MAAISNFITRLFDFLLVPFQSAAPIWGLVFISAVSGIILVKIYGSISNQRLIKRIKTRISAGILESVLFRHDLVVTLRAQGGMLKNGALYFLAAIPPLLVLIVPCLFILAQLNLRYNNAPIEPGSSAVIKVALSDPSKTSAVEVSPSSEITLSPPVRVPADGEVWLKASAPNNPGEFTLSLKGPSTELTIPLYVGSNPTHKISSLVGSSTVMQLMYPSASGRYPSGDFKSIEVRYPTPSTKLFGLSLHWILVFFIVSLISGLVAAKIFKIEI